MVLLGILGFLAPVSLIVFVSLAYYGPPSDLGSQILAYRVIPLLYLIAIITAILMIIYPKKRYISPLQLGRKWEFILCNEGLYAYLRPKKRKKYHLYPWNSLRLYRVDNEKKVIGLKKKRKLIKLTDEEDFDGLKSIILKYLSTEDISKGEKQRSHIGIFMLLLFVYGIAWVGISSYYDYSSMLNSPEDELCDICGIHAPYVLEGIKYFGGLERERRTVHEYCEVHAMIYSAVHPLVGIRSEDSQLSGVSILGLYIFTLAVWVSIPQWYKYGALRR